MPAGVSADVARAMLAVAKFVAMEIVAALAHRYVMHGPLWCRHRSRHEPRRDRWERNDLFAVLVALPSTALVCATTHGHAWLLPAAIGTVAYGAVYVLFHDGRVHRRAPTPRRVGRYLRGSCRRTTSITRCTRATTLCLSASCAPDPRELRRRRTADRVCRS